MFEKAEPARVHELSLPGRCLALLPLAIAALLLSTVATGAAGDALVILVFSAIVLGLNAILWARREGLISPVPIATLGLMVYFPVRGLVLLTFGLSNEQGINQRVLDALPGGGAFAASLDILMAAAAFTIGCEIVWRLGRRRDVAEAASNTEGHNQALARWAGALLVVGLLGVLLQVPAGLGWLRGDEASGGLQWYLVYLAGFGFSLGIILSGRANGGLPPWIWILLAAVGVLAFYMGSKDTLFQPLIALLFAGAGVVRPTNSKRRLIAAGVVLAALVFLIFPAVTTYRNEIFAGQSFTQALEGVPQELAGKTVVGSLPRSGGALGYVGDSLLYLTNRLSGFDAVLLSSNYPPDPQMLTAQSIVLSPLGLVLPSSYWSSSIAQPGHYYGQQYWGSVPGSNVSTAVTVFGQVQFAFGSLAVLLAALILGIFASLAGRYYRAPSRSARALGFILMITALGFEHDVLYLLITTERRLALLGLVVLLASMGSRRPAEAPWALSAPAPSPLTRARAR